MSVGRWPSQAVSDVSLPTAGGYPVLASLGRESATLLWMCSVKRGDVQGRAGRRAVPEKRSRLQGTYPRSTWNWGYFRTVDDPTAIAQIWITGDFHTRG